MMRAELADTGRQLVGPQTYNTLFTVHGIIMIFLFVAPFGVGLANYLIPLRSARPTWSSPPERNVLVLRGGGLLVLLSSFATDAGGVATGWYLYPPLSGPRYSPASRPICDPRARDGRGVDPDVGGERDHDDVPVARPRYDDVAAARVHVERGGHRDPGARGVPAGGGGVRAAAVRPSSRRAGVRPSRRRRPRRLPAPVLVPWTSPRSTS